MSIRLLTPAMALASLTLLSLPALSHVTLDVREASAGTNQKLVIRVPHGCEGTATTAIRIRIPDTVPVTKPQPKPGWTLSVVREKLAKPMDAGHGRTVTEAVREVVWSGGKLPDDWYDEFVMRVTLPETPDAVLYFPVVQQCEKGVHRWIEIPEAGKSRDDLREPAPALRLKAKAR